MLSIRWLMAPTAGVAMPAEHPRPRVGAHSVEQHDSLHMSQYVKTPNKAGFDRVSGVRTWSAPG
jgi:hypothetical protein